MRIFLAIIIVLHALIHLMGFTKGFGWYDPKALTLPINKFWGSLWLLSALALLFYAFSYLQLENRFALKIGIIALALSQIVIFNYWQDAKFGTIANLIILVVLLFSYAQDQFSQMVMEENQALLSEIHNVDQSVLKRQHIQHLPAPVKRWLEHSGSLNKSIPTYVTLRQSMRMKIKPEQSQWYSATAEQLTTIRPPAFIWKTNVNIFPLVEMAGRDKFFKGKGEMLIKLNSLFTVVDATGEKIDEGALQRFLGEIAWVPGFALSPYIEWESIDDHAARATLSYQGTSGSGIFHFDSEGNFTKFTAMRFKDNEPKAKRYEWIMSALAYDTFAGVRIPSLLEATWVLEDGDWTWLEMKVEAITTN